MTRESWGIDEGFEDTTGGWHPIEADTRQAILSAMDAGTRTPTAPGSDRPLVIRQGESARVAPSDLKLEDGAMLKVDDALPRDLPLGYHELHDVTTEERRRLIVAPARCHVPAVRAWGWAAQLYATRSNESWGFGDLADLHRLARWSARDLGASALLVNPLFAALPLTPREPSPYSPSSRRYRDPLYLRIEDVPGAADVGAPIERLALMGQALNADRRIDRDEVARVKREALDLAWQRFGGDQAFDRYREEQGAALREFAVFTALAEHHRRGWRDWPSEHQHPTSGAVARFTRDHDAEVHFHEWVQWLLDVQLARASSEIAVVHDLPIGVDENGADAWVWQDVITTEATVGAPPDPYNARGQDWGLPPMVPHRLQASGYEPFIQTVRAALRHAGGLRIDHVMGLFRLFWIPRRFTPAAGGYVRYPADDLLAILALESHRAFAFVVGEDLGTVERGVRERLAAEGVLSYRVVWFEADHPSRYPELALAAVTTHDLPTIAGLWSGADFVAQEQLGLEPRAEAMQSLRARLSTLTGLSEDADVRRVIHETYRSLGEAPSLIVAATLEDALAVEDRPNMPGTQSRERPNWSLALPASIETLETWPGARTIADALAHRSKAGGKGEES